MASEFSIVHNAAGATLYGIIRRVSDYYVWNGTTFETWASGSVGNYDIALTDRGGDLYTADMPSGVAAGDYLLLYYLQAGGSPAITDLAVGRPQRRYWNGTVASSGSSVTLSGYALATLTQVKRDLAITDSTYDTHLTEIINYATAFIEQMTRRKWEAREYRERLNGTMAYVKTEPRLTLRTKQFPIIRLTKIAYGFGSAFTLTYTGSGIEADATIYNDYSSDTSGGIRLVSIAAAGTATTNNLLFADYPSVSTIIAAIDAISGWNATIVADGPSADLNPMHLGNAVADGTLTATYPDTALPDHLIDYQTGVIQMRGDQWRQWIAPSAFPLEPRQYYAGRAPAGFGDVLLVYRAGVESIASATDGLGAVLNGIARKMVVREYHRQGEDLEIVSNSLGDAAWQWDRSDSDAIKAAAEQSNIVDISSMVA